MKTLEIVFTKSKKFMPIGSWLIRLWTWKPYSHVARYKNILGVDMYYQASEGSVNYETKQVFDKKHEILRIYRLSVPDSLELKMSIECLKNAGKKYAFSQNIGIFLVDLLRLVGIKIKNPFNKGRNCSELLYVTILKKIHPELNYDPQTIKPHHIEDILRTKGYKEL